MTKITKIASLFLLLFGITLGRIWRVPEQSPPPNAIQNAINDSVANGDTISVAPGTYPEHISFKGKNIVVGSRGYVEPGSGAPRRN